MRDTWLEMWAKEGALFQKAGIMSVQELIQAADLNCDGVMSMEEFLEFIKKNAEKNEEAMYQARSLPLRVAFWLLALTNPPQPNTKDEMDFMLGKIRARYDAIEAEQQAIAVG